MTYKEKLEQIDTLKDEMNQYRPLDDFNAKQLKEYFRIRLVYSSNALEGNSLTESETKVVIEDGITVGGKTIRDHNEALGHSEAYDLLYELSQNKEITEENIKDLHRLFFYRIDQSEAGQYRKKQVIITGTEFIPPSPSEIIKKMEQFSADITVVRDRMHPVESAAYCHRELVTIHPFIDGNGRTARLLMNLILMQDGYGIAIIPPILRAQYIAALRTAQEKGDDNPFKEMIADMVYETMKDTARLLKAVE